jgi:SAM-dependent methyltransferase
MNSPAWTKEVFNARSNTITKRGYPPGSPDDNELQVYHNMVKSHAKGNALVMGMTIGLREVLHALNFNVFCLEVSEDAIAFLQDGVDVKLQSKESIIHDNWFEMPQNLATKFDYIVGDGAFNNALSVTLQNQLLQSVKDSLKPNGIFVTRYCLKPHFFDIEAARAENVIAEFRAGVIDDAEFGHIMRIWGLYELAHNHETFLLDNPKVYSVYEEWYESGKLKEEEYKIINRQYFNGKHFYPTQEVWENTLEKVGFIYEASFLRGFTYCQYLPICRCSL